MKRAIRKYSRDFIAIVVLFVIAFGVGGYILSNQRFYLPKWVPAVGSDFVDRKLEITTAQSVTPGQGQEVTIAGVKVGEIARVDLEEGRAVITMKLRREHSDIYRDASALLRPKTGLNDMLIELDPGHEKAGEAPENWRVPLGQTLANVNADEVLAALDGDTRDYLRLLVAGAGEGLRGNTRNLSNTFRRLEPLNRDLNTLTKGLAKRRGNIRRSVHNFRLVTEAIGEKDQQLTELVDASNAVFTSFTNQDARLRETLQLLPGTLTNAQVNLAKADRLARTLGPTLQALRPAARALGPSLRQTRPFVREAVPIIRTQLRPFARDALPAIRDLRPAARDLAELTPDLRSVLQTANTLFNTLAYNPPGDREEGYLFWASWANHIGTSLFATQDAHGPIRRGLVLVSCASLSTLQTIAAANPALGTLVSLLNPVTQAEACPNQAGAGSGNRPGTGRSGGGVQETPPATRAGGGK